MNWDWIRTLSQACELNQISLNTQACCIFNLYLFILFSFSQSACLLGAVGAGELPGWRWEQTPPNGPSTNSTFQRSCWYSLWFGATTPPPPTGKTGVTSLLIPRRQKLSCETVAIKCLLLFPGSPCSADAELPRKGQRQAKWPAELWPPYRYLLKEESQGKSQTLCLLPNLILGSCHCFFFFYFIVSWCDHLFSCLTG